MRIEIAGLPALTVTGEIAAPEREVGITEPWVLSLDWNGAECLLTPEQEILVEECLEEIEREFLDRSLAEAADELGAAYDADAIYLRACEGW